MKLCCEKRKNWAHRHQRQEPIQGTCCICMTSAGSGLDVKFMQTFLSTEIVPSTRLSHKIEPTIVNNLAFRTCDSSKYHPSFALLITRRIRSIMWRSGQKKQNMRKEMIQYIPFIRISQAKTGPKSCSDKRH